MPQGPLLRGCILPSSKKSTVNLWSPYQPCIHAHNGYYLLFKREHYCRKSLLACGHLCKASISCLCGNSTALLQSQYLLTETLVKFELFQLLLNKNMSKHFLNFSFKLAKACQTSIRPTEVKAILKCINFSGSFKTWVSEWNIQWTSYCWWGLL